MTLDEFAKTLFEAYRAAGGQTGVPGAPNPTWDMLTDPERASWLAVARVADDAHRIGQRGGPQPQQAAHPIMGGQGPGIPFVPPDPDRFRGRS
jgi:hypothetical protein